MHPQDIYLAIITVVRILKQTPHQEKGISSNNHNLNVLQTIDIVRYRVEFSPIRILETNPVCSYDHNRTKVHPQDIYVANINFVRFLSNQLCNTKPS